MTIVLLCFLILHILICILCAFLTWRDILKSTYIDVFILFFIPVFGLVALLIRSHIYRNEERQAKNLELGRLQIEDSVQRSIILAENEETDEVIPLSESFAVNDSHTQRLLMKEALFDLNTRIDIDLVTRPASRGAHYKVFTVHQYKSYTNNYPQQLKPLLSFILNNIQNTIINQFSNKLSYACTTTLNNTHDKKLVNSVPQMY